MFPVQKPTRFSNTAGFNTPADTFVLRPRGLGLGEDRLIGGTTGPVFRVIDLSLLTEPVEIQWTGQTSGMITDGADTIVFQGVEEIILPPCMRAPESQPAPEDQPAPEPTRAPLLLLPAA